MQRLVFKYIRISTYNYIIGYIHAYDVVHIIMITLQHNGREFSCVDTSVFSYIIDHLEMQKPVVYHLEFMHACVFSIWDLAS